MMVSVTMVVDLTRSSLVVISVVVGGMTVLIGGYHKRIILITL